MAIDPGMTLAAILAAEDAKPISGRGNPCMEIHVEIPREALAMEGNLDLLRPEEIRVRRAMLKLMCGPYGARDWEKKERRK